MYNRIFSIIICVLIAAALLQGCSEKPAVDSQDKTIDIKYEEQDNSNNSAALIVENKLVRRDMDIVCGDTYTLAVCMSGDILTAGNAGGVFRNKDDIYGAYMLAASGDTVAAVMSDGTVRIIGDSTDLYADALNWTDVVQVAFGYDFLAGLKADGTIVACGNNAWGQCDTDNIRGVVKISAGDYHLAALLEDGTVKLTGAYEGIGGIEEWKNVEQIACGDTFTIGICRDGSVLQYHAEFAEEWKDVVHISARGEVAAAIISDGSILTNAPYIKADNTQSVSDTDGITGVDAIAVGDGFMAVRCGYEIKCFGDNSFLQCETDKWDMGIMLSDDGYITGFPCEMKTEIAKEILSDEFNCKVSLKKQSGKQYKHEFIGTGAVVCDSDGEKLGEVLIYGDVNGDGMTDMKDVDALDKHISSGEELEGAYLRAAHVMHYDSDTQPINNDDREALLAHIEGTSHIKQYVYNPFYDDMRKYYRINNDVIGYVRIEGTNIDYPILYGGSEYYYHMMTIYHEYSEIGSIYSIHGDYMKNNIVLGHNARKTGRMFNNLHRIQNKGEALLEYKNRIIGLMVYREYSEWELYALYETGPNEPVSTQKNNIQSLNGLDNDEIQAWIDGQKARSEIDLGVDVCAEDTLLTMYTCGDRYYSDSTAQARLYLFFRRVA